MRVGLGQSCQAQSLHSSAQNLRGRCGEKNTVLRALPVKSADAKTQVPPKKRRQKPARDIDPNSPFAALRNLNLAEPKKPKQQQERPATEQMAGEQVAGERTE